MSIRSARNVLLGVCFLIVAVTLLVVQLLPHIDVAARVIVILVALEMVWIGARLVVTSRLQITSEAIVMRNRWGKKITIPCNQIQSVEMGSRNFAYDRSFPRIHLTSGEVLDLFVFEQPSARASKHDSSVKHLIEILSPLASG